MIALLLRLALHLLVAVASPDPVAVDAFRETAPDDLSPSGALDHYVASAFAAWWYRLDANDLRAAAHHESRYTDKVEREPTGFYSCGVMTPYDAPRRYCPEWTLTTLGGYMHGAAHLAEWYRICRGSRVCALRGYTGNQMDRQQPGALAWVRFAQRSERIRRTIEGL